jgi:alkylated DNA repair dioxygenase AlkB
MLFPSQNLLPCDGEVFFVPDFLSFQESMLLWNHLKGETLWKQESMKIFGKTVLFPRLTAWYAEAGKAYSYAGVTHQPTPFPALLHDLKAKIEQHTERKFNAALLNYYRDGQDSMGWHADNEPELGQNPSIASVSLGAVRKFQLKHRLLNNHRVSILLQTGSLLMMQGSTQHHWLHQIPKVKNTEARINITFRWIH